MGRIIQIGIRPEPLNPTVDQSQYTSIPCACPVGGVIVITSRLHV